MHTRDVPIPITLTQISGGQESIFLVWQHTRWPKSHDTEIKIEYLPYRSIEEADFFINDIGTSKLYTHMNIAEKNLCEVPLLD